MRLESGSARPAPRVVRTSHRDRLNRLDLRWFALAIVAAVVVGNAIVLAPELTVGRVDLNDAVFHYTIIDAIVTRLSHGQSALEFWMPEWSFGYPVLRAYQPLGAWIVALIQIATAQHFPLDATFAFVRYALLVLFPLTAYAAARLLDFDPLTAAAASVVTPLITSGNYYGLDYGSYVWRGNGLFTQLVAMHLFVLAIGVGSRAIRRGRHVTLAALLVALTILAHLIYGYMAAATLVLLVAIPRRDSAARERFVRLAWIGIFSFAATAFLLAPMLGSGAFINRSRWEPAWKWESFGLKEVLSLVATGDVIDADRLPIISAFALAGTIALIRRRRTSDWFPLAGAALWMFLFAGSKTWGPLFNVLGIGDQVQAHRFIGGVHWFLILLAAIGLARLWTFRRPWGAIISLALLALPIAERIAYMRDDRNWGDDNLAAYNAQRPDIDRTLALLQSRGGRAYPGLAATWGMQFKVGYVPFYAFMSRAHVPAVAFLYHAMALPADIMVRFDETRPDHYRLFDIRSAVADVAHPMPAFLTPIATNGRFRLFAAPPSSAFDLVDAPASIYADRRTFYDVNDAWLRSKWPATHTHALLDYESAVPTAPLPRLGGAGAFSRPQPARSCGAATGERITGDVYAATIDATAPCFLLLKSTYHPNWRADVDGRPQPVVMLTPGFAAVRVQPGRHTVTFTYEHGAVKTALLILALPLLSIGFVLERRGAIGRAEALEWHLPRGDRRYVILAIALALPCIAPLVGTAESGGHDALEYLPRLVEFHENIRQGVLLPRWAPDLSSGQGQPIFLLNPPLIYYLAELWHLLGLSFTASINAAVATIVIASALSMFLLARFWFGPAGGLLGSVAYIYAPYFLVDLYVRAALAELSAFPFYPLALYGFAKHADDRKPRPLVVGIIGYAGVWLAHTPAAVLFTPLLGAFIVFLAWQHRSVKQVLVHVAACVVALALAAPFWVPGAVEASDTNSQRLTEGALKYSNHYVYPHQFFSLDWGYGVSVPGDQDEMPFTLGWAELLIAAIAAILVVPERKRWFAFFAFAAFGVCFLMTGRSHAVWDAIPQLHYVAFPWRLLADAIVCVALLVASAVAAKRVTTAVAAAFVAIVVLSALPHTRPQSYLTLDPQLWTPHQIAARGVIPATFDTFEPRWVQTRPTYTGDRIGVNRGDATSTITSRSPIHLAATVHALADSELELPIAYFPGWRVTVDGNDVRVDEPSASGRMRMTVSPGDHRIDARFGSTPIRTASNVASLVAIVLLVVAVVRLR